MIKDLRLHTARNMKMEPAPWIKDHVVNMEELYTQLTLEQIDEKLFREERTELEGYRELFPLYDSEKILKYLNIMYYLPGIKILIKGDPGMGKTSLVKKIAWDWAKRQFVQVSVVFFIDLKLIEPGDAIENAIIQQAYPLTERGYTKEKISQIVQYYGQECLLILDGLDECAQGQNDEVRKIVRGSKYMNCNIVLTSRPHSTGEIEKYFDTVVSVEGFTPNEARKFASCILTEKKKVEAVLNFNPAGERSDRPVHNVPILLSFLCLLVREDNIDLSHKEISMGEIYFRMVQCLYKKFTLRKGIRFETSSLVTVLMSIGKLALETLLSGNPLLERSQITEQVGEDVFEYGLLIGEDGFSLTRDMTVDILVTFPHRSLQEFLGAFYFVLSLGEEQIVKDIDKAFHEFWQNPLFLEFCLWFLDESNKFLSLQESSIACHKLSSYIREPIDAEEVNFCKLEGDCPALSLALGDKRNQIALKILEGSLVKCSRIKHIVIGLYHPIDRILRSISPIVIWRLNSIKISNFQESTFMNRSISKLITHHSPLLFVDMWRDHGFNLTVECDLTEKHSADPLNTVLKVCEGWGRSVYLHVIGIVPKVLSQELPSVPTLSIDSRSSISTLSMYKTHPQLVNLFLTDCNLDSRDMSHLVEANAQRTLPRLSVLDISGNEDIGGNLSMLLSKCFPSLTTLILRWCELQITDICSLTQAMREVRLPQLRHLDISFNYHWKTLSGNVNSASVLPLLFQQGNPTLKTLAVRKCCLNSNGLHQLRRQAEELNNILIKLTTLDMSLNEAIGGSLSVLMCHYLLHLQILVLRESKLNSEDLYSLAQASNQGRLPELRHLDISQNDIGGEKRGLFRLFGSLSGFSPLLNLMLCECRLQLRDLHCLRQAKLDGKLPRIRHLDISLNGLSGHVGILSRDPFTQREISWGNVVCYDLL